MVTKTSSIKKSSEQDRAEMVDLQELVRVLVRNVGLGICIIQDGKFQYVNPLLEKFSGYAEEELLGKNILDLVHPEDRGKVGKKAIESLKEQSSISYEYRFIKKNGEVWWVLETVVPIPYGGRPAAIASFMDITERKQAEDVLRQSEEKYKNLVNVIGKTGEGILILQDTDEREASIVFANDEIAGVTGYLPEEMLEKSAWDLLTPGSCTKAQELRKQRLKDEGDLPTRYELMLMCKNGRVLPVEVGAGVINYNGKAASVVLIKDITDRKQVEERLAESEAKYRAIIDHANDAIVVVKDLKFILANQMAKVLGYTSDEVLELDYTDILTPESLEVALEKYQRRMSGEEVESTYAVDMIHKDGHLVPVEMSNTVIEYEGGPADLIIARDVTERKWVEEALRKSEEKYRTVLETMEEGYFEVDLAGNLTFFNDSLCRILERSREEMIGMNYRAFTAEDNIEYVYKMFNQVYSTGKPVAGFAWEAMRKDGDKRFIEISISVLRNQERGIIGFRGLARDITERKQAEEEREALLEDLGEVNRKLTQSNKELQDFVYVASHDLREPLRKITSFGALLQDSLEGKLDEDEQENLGFMIDGAGRMQEMIDDLLSYSRVTTQAKLFERVDLNKVINDLEKLELATLLDETGGTIHIPETLPSVQGDLSQMHQLFQNLVGNGLKFHRAGISPEVIINAHHVKGNMIRVEVQDNGVGIDEEYHEQVFTMFKRLHSRQSYAGTGIGLSICKKIVDRHGGDIGIESTPGGGSTFWFMLPRGSYSA